MTQLLTITIGSLVLATEAEHAHGILGALQHAKVYEKSWRGDEYTEQEKAVEFGFADPAKFVALPDPLKKIQEEAATNSTRWLEEYHQHQTTKAKLKEAEAKLARLSDSLAA